MNLPETKERQEYIDEIKIIESKLKDAADGDLSDANFKDIQTRLDKLASRFQHKDEIGSGRYKMYELQAMLYYFQKKDGEALDFINQAIETKGESYARAEKLKEKLSTKDELIEVPTKKSKKHKSLVGLNGWLAWYIVGLGLSAIVLIVSIFGYGDTIKDVAAIQSQNIEMYNSFVPALWYEIFYQIVCVGLAIYAIVLFAQKKIQAKTVAIGFMLTITLGTIIDYAWLSSIASAFSLSPETLSSTATAIGRDIIYCLIWIPYLINSKRIKATLTK